MNGSREKVQAKSRPLYQDPAHIVIGPVNHDQLRDISSAPLFVPEIHPYFFDHPLDHVPGILLLEGIFQLFHQAAMERLHLPENQETYIKKVKISFRHWCEKDLPIELELVPKKKISCTSCPLAFEGRVIQKKKTTCLIQLEGDLADSEPFSQDKIVRHTPDILLPERKLVHRHKAENVLISNIRPEGRRSCTCDLLSPPRGHIFSSGNFSCYSMLYLLETIRQFSLYMAHRFGRISLDLSIILLSFRFSLRRPVYRQDNLTLTSHRQPISLFNDMLMGTIEVILHGQDGLLGEGSIRSLVVSQKIYQIQRWKRSG